MRAAVPAADNYEPTGQPRPGGLLPPGETEGIEISLTGAALKVAQPFVMSGFVHLRSENREKSRSVVQSMAPCSMAMATSIRITGEVV